MSFVAQMVSSVTQLNFFYLKYCNENHVNFKEYCKNYSHVHTIYNLNYVQEMKTLPKKPLSIVSFHIIIFLYSDVETFIFIRECVFVFDVLSRLDKSNSLSVNS